MTEFAFTQLARFAKKDSSALPQYKLAISGDCATEHLAVALKGRACAEGIGLCVFDAGYDRIVPCIMDTASELYAFSPDGVLLYLCVEKLYEIFCRTGEEKRRDFAQISLARVEEYWRRIGENSKAALLQFNFAEKDDLVFGNYANKRPSSFIYQLRKLNYLLAEAASKNRNVFLVDLCRVQSLFGRKALFDPKLYSLAKMPLTTAILPEVAKEVIGVIKELCGAGKKCVVLDLDNTLWGGNIGDDGLAGIQIGELGIGRAFTELQIWLKELKNRGILLAVCSKNDENIAKEPFVRHDEMVLRLEDIAVFVANWEDKAGNIRRIRETLNIGMDSMVFVDDSPFERAAVRSLIPEITVPDLPEDPALYLTCLQNLNLFETTSFSAADTQRTALYQAAAKAAESLTQYATYDEYLRDLGMTAAARPFDEMHYARIAQLTQRANQFNLRAIRYSEAEIAAAAHNGNLYTLYFTLQDKFTDYGLIGVVVMEKQRSDTLFVDTWLMSCRALGRGMEEFIVNTMLETAQRNGFAFVVGEYDKTAKNSRVENIYEKLGFSAAGQGKFIAATESFTLNKTFVNAAGCAEDATRNSA